MTVRKASTLAAIATALAVPVALLAHAVVYPDVAPPGAYQMYLLRGPTEREVPTTRVAIRFPDEVTVVSFADVPGWELAVETDSSGRVVGATWTGTLPPQRFVEFPFVAVNPRAHATIVWPVTQTYAGGEVVEWAGPEDSDTPASVTLVRSAGGWQAGTWLAAAALVIGLIALGLALRHPASRPRSPAAE